MSNASSAEIAVGLGAFPHELMADEVIEISDDMLIELGMGDQEQATAQAVPPPIPPSS